MDLSRLLLEELEREAVSTRKILQVVPDGQLEWRPHEKSFTLGRLATHVAELPLWLGRALDADEFDMLANPLPRHVVNSNAELLTFFEEKLQSGINTLEGTTDDMLMQPWTFRRGEHVISRASRYETIRMWMMNHQVHHRGQLSVYLRLLDVPIPGMYGPSADDMIARQG